jgi:uncharacterized protein YqhQ
MRELILWIGAYYVSIFLFVGIILYVLVSSEKYWHK